MANCYFQGRDMPSLHLFLTTLCSMRCPDCCMNIPRIRGRRLDVAEVEEAGRLLHGIEHLYVTGGEPAMHPRPGKDGCLVFELEMTCMAEAGECSFAAFLGRPTERPNRGEALEQTPWLGPLRVEWDDDAHKAPFIGMLGIPCTGGYAYPRCGEAAEDQ